MIFDALVRAVLGIQTLADLPVVTPEGAQRAIEVARVVSEGLAGSGETKVLTSVPLISAF
jgi:hypothetical protein